MNCLMKFVQSNFVFVSDYVAAVKICQAELYMMYSDCDMTWLKSHFEMFHDIINDHFYTITQEWVTDLNMGSQTLAFQIGDHTYLVHSVSLVTRQKFPVTRLRP